MRRGSATSRVAPFSLARKMRRATRGWQAVVLEPVTKMQAASSISAMELVIAPLPKAAVRPTTVEECQRRAQWSTLLVPTTARANFCRR